MFAKFNAVLGIYLIALMFAVMNVFLQVMPISTVPYLSQALHETPEYLLNIVSLYLVAYALMQVPIGALFDRVGVRYVLPAGLFLTTLGSYLFMLGSSLYIIAIGRILCGVGCSCSYIAGVYIASRYFRPGNLTLLIAAIEASSIYGAILSAKPFSRALTYLGWQNTHLCIVGICLILFILSIIAFKNIPVEAEVCVQKLSLITKLRILFKNKVLTTILVYSFCTWMIMMSFAGYWLKEYMENVHHYTELRSLGIDEIYWTSFIVASICLGLLLHSFKSYRIAAIGLALLNTVTFIILIIPVVFSLGGIIVFVIFAGISAAGIVVAFSMIPHLINKKMTGTAIALNNTFVVLGAFTGQYCFGFLLKSANIYLIDPHISWAHYYTALCLYPVVSLVGLIFLIYGQSLHSKLHIR